jgi:hypothetical protein
MRKLQHGISCQTSVFNQNDVYCTWRRLRADTDLNVSEPWAPRDQGRLTITSILPRAVAPPRSPRIVTTRPISGRPLHHFKPPVFDPHHAGTRRPRILGPRGGWKESSKQPFQPPRLPPGDRVQVARTRSHILRDCQKFASCLAKSLIRTPEFHSERTPEDVSQTIRRWSR